MVYLIVLLCLLVLALSAGWFISNKRKIDEIIQRDNSIIRLETELSSEQKLRENERTLHEKMLQDLKDNQASFIKAAQDELAVRSNDQLKKHEEALSQKAADALKSVTDGLNKDIREMKQSFDANKEAQISQSAALKTKMEETARHMTESALSIGSQAQNLANAIKGKNKMQGIFGETVLENMLKAEGLRLGTDYDKEYWIRDDEGGRIVNEETQKMMRPDFVLHFPDGTNVILDSKVSLTALSDYYDAETDEQRQDAIERNLQSVWNHVKELSTKKYQEHFKKYKTLEYTIMFIPTWGAYQLAKESDSTLFASAFNDYKVLITTEETLIPFLKMVNNAWVQSVQMDNMAKIIDKARMMVERVILFCEQNEKLGGELRSALKIYEDNTNRLITSKQSIVNAANDVVELGVKPTKKKLPSTKGDANKIAERDEPDETVTEAE